MTNLSAFLCLLTLAACGGDDEAASVDAAGARDDIDCALIANSASATNLAQAEPRESCSFNVAGIDWIDQMGMPSVFSVGEPVTLIYIGPNTYRSDIAFTWTGDAGQIGVAMPVAQNRCAWLRCLAK